MIMKILKYTSVWEWDYEILWMDIPAILKRGHDRDNIVVEFATNMVIGFATTYAISAYHH